MRRTLCTPPYRYPIPFRLARSQRAWLCGKGGEPTVAKLGEVPTVSGASASGLIPTLDRFGSSCLGHRDLPMGLTGSWFPI